MAVAGDVIIKLAADVAELKRGLSESQAAMQEFGKAAVAINEKLDVGATVLKGLFSADAIIGGFKALAAELDRIEEKFAAINAQAGKLGVSFEVFEALRLSALKSGQGTEKLADAMARFKTLTDQAVSGSREAITTLNKLGVTILDGTGNLRQQADINTRLAQSLLGMPEGFEKTRMQLALLGTSGEAANKQLAALTLTQAQLKQGFDNLGVGQTVEQLEELRRRSEFAREKFDLLLASIALPIKASGLEAVAAAMQKIVDAINGLREGSAETFMKVLMAAGALGTGNLPGVIAAFSTVPTALERADTVVAAQQKNVEALKDSYTALFLAGEQQSGQAIQAYAALEKGERDLMDAQMKRAALGGGLVIDITKPGGGGKNPPLTGTAGGKTDADNMEAQIARYRALGEAATRIYGNIVEKHGMLVDDLQREYKVQQQIEDIAARLGAKYSQASDAQKAQLREVITFNERARESTERLLRAKREAEDVDARFGDGRVAQRRLDEQRARLTTGGASPQAITRFTKQQTEAFQEASRAASRYDDDIASLATGFEDAMARYARANDLFSQGGRIFDALMTSMGDVFDVLAGKSSKTFEQIASDFALMLAKMALQAAVSQIFKTLIGALAGAPSTAGATTTPGNIFSMFLPAPAGNRAVGGDVMAGRSYRVGEFGPETYVPTANGRIEPYVAAGGGGGGGTVVVNLDMKKAEGARDPSAALEFGRRVKAAVVDVIQNEKRPGGTLYARGA